MVSENKVKNAEWDTKVLLCPWPTYIVTCTYTTHIHTYKVSLLYKKGSNKEWRGKRPRGGGKERGLFLVPSSTGKEKDNSKNKNT